MPKPEVPIHISMASSYATIASKPPAPALSTAAPIPEVDEEAEVKAKGSVVRIN